LTTPKNTITVFIPLKLKEEPDAPPTVMFQPDSHNNNVKKPVIWQIESPFRIPGQSAIVVEKGRIHFLLKEFAWKPNDGEEVTEHTA